MPAIVGAIKINNVSAGSIVHIGDSVQLAPQSVAKTFAGAGSFNTGDNLRVYNYVSTTNTYDNDLLDSNIALTN
ncbi:spore germination protein PA [Paenibacillus sp. UNCCL117]|uniref:spore germination protein n=1 Tax=unclassified Paenibacillus TaxID=185978 RepID=UPI000885AC47|nr:MULTISPECIES: spore germination protein [unclassified Paenibacillus]SDC77169.1 spore germination protein PA [Paenibacillus sp. cl123]SFW25763.1 spore germination protein PA [Paenibacillus sp. UNCCL117]